MSLTKEVLIERLRTVIDPELNINIVDLGLVYRADIDPGGNVSVEMTLTTQGCPMREYMEASVNQALQDLEGLKSLSVEVVWDPPWTPDKIDHEALQRSSSY